MHTSIKSFAKTIARQTVGKLPPSASRFTGKLALDGGTPVRDTRFRPWADRASGRTSFQSRNVLRAFRQILSSGAEGLPQTRAKQFGRLWADHCGARFGLLLPHGTDALRIGLAALLDHDGLDYGGEVIVPNFTFIASAAAALDRRFGVALVDVDPTTLLLDARRVEEAIVPGKTRAIMPVHLFGQPADMTALQEIARKHGLKIIEDAAQAHGAAWVSGRVGSLGDAAAFSFQSFKNLNCGEGGALTTNDEEVFERAYSMHNVGRPRTDAGRWEHLTLGWNCRPTEYQAALLLNRFEDFKRQQEVRSRNFVKLRTLMDESPCLRPLAVHPGVRRHGVHMFVMRYQQEQCAGLELTEFLKAVQAEGIPMHRAYEATIAGQPAIQKLMDRRPEYFRVLPTPVSDQAVQDVVYIAHEVFLGSESDMTEIAAAIRKVESHYSRSAVSHKTIELVRPMSVTQ